MHYAIQAVVGLDNCHLWQFQRRPYDHGFIIRVESDGESMGLESCDFNADETPLTAFLGKKGDKLSYIYDFCKDWIFTISVMEVLKRKGDVAELTKYKSDLQALDDYFPDLYMRLREFMNNPETAGKEQVEWLAEMLDADGLENLQYFGEDYLIDPEFVAEELSNIPDHRESNW